MLCLFFSSTGLQQVMGEGSALSEPRLYYTQILASAHYFDVCCRVAALWALWLSRDGDATHEIHQLPGAPLLKLQVVAELDFIPSPTSDSVLGLLGPYALHNGTTLYGITIGGIALKINLCSIPLLGQW